MTPLALGIDVGGTKIAAALVDLATGAIVRGDRIPADPSGPDALARTAALAAAVAGDAAPLPIGLGVCETVAPDGRITSAATYDWAAADLAGAFRGTGPVAIESDVRAVARAECAFGAAAGSGSALVLVAGSGVSCCLAIDGRPWTGARGNAIIVGSPPVEHRAGGAAVLARTGRSFEDLLAAPEGAAEAEAVIAALGNAVATLVNALDPAIAVLGGGIGTAPGVAERVAAAARDGIWATGTRDLPIVPAALGPEAGVIGAALAAPTAQ